MTGFRLGLTTLGAAAVLAAGSGATASATEPPWKQALSLRSDALNRQYGLGPVSMRPDDPGMHGVGAVASDVPAAELAVRLDGTRGPAPVTHLTRVAPSIVHVDGGFDWLDAAMGAAGGLVLVLVAGAATVGMRGRRRVHPAEV